jgi:hypothetical protein
VLKELKPLVQILEVDLETLAVEDHFLVAFLVVFLVEDLLLVDVTRLVESELDVDVDIKYE